MNTIVSYEYTVTKEVIDDMNDHINFLVKLKNYMENIRKQRIDKENKSIKFDLDLKRQCEG